MIAIRRIKLYIVGLLALMGTVAGAQTMSELPVKTVNGNAYHYYIVKQHETVYALSKRFGITPEQLIKYNPTAADGLKIDQELLFPADKKVTDDSKKAEGTYVVKRHETAYGISKRFNLTLEEFYELNPGARDGVQEGQTVIVNRGAVPPKITVMPADKLPPVHQTAAKPATSATNGRKHVIQEHETLYQIARDNDIRLLQLLEANPGLDAARYSAGQEIIIPAKGDGIISDADKEVHPSEINQSQMPDKITIAVALPFNLDKKEKHNRNMVEFYRGILFAVDSMRNCGAPIHLLTYDTESTKDGVAQIIDMPELKSADVIIAPDNMEDLQTFNEFGKQNGISIVNSFNNRDSSFQSNPYALQMALPRDEMYNRAVNAFLESFEGYVPVILVSNTGKRDKLEFTELIKARLDKSGAPYKEIGYNEQLSKEFLDQHLEANEKYAFLPSSSSKEEFENIVDALQAYKSSRDFGNEIVVWGYPEWLANRAGYSKMHQLDCYIYSRTDLPESFESANLDSGYTKWFGPEMMTNYPRRYYMGFDIGMVVIKSLCAGKDGLLHNMQFHSGVAMPVMMKRYGDNGGMFNNQLLMINLAPGEIISKRTI